MQTRTRRQHQVFEFISRYIENHGFEPSYQLIARHLGVTSKAGVAKHVKALEEQGLLTRRTENGKFSLGIIRDCEQPANGTSVEWLDADKDAERPAGWPTESFEMPAFLLGNLASSRIMAYRVTDNSMSGKNICAGDIALVEPRSFVRDGSIIVAGVRHKSNILRLYYRNGSKVELRPADETSESVTLAADKVNIIGVYRGLIRPID